MLQPTCINCPLTPATRHTSALTIFRGTVGPSPRPARHEQACGSRFACTLCTAPMTGEQARGSTSEGFRSSGRALLPGWDRDCWDHVVDKPEETNIPTGAIKNHPQGQYLSGDVLCRWLHRCEDPGAGPQHPGRAGMVMCARRSTSCLAADHSELQV